MFPPSVKLQMFVVENLKIKGENFGQKIIHPVSAQADYGFSCCYVNGSSLGVDVHGVVLAGGYISSTSTSDAYLYDLDEGSWRQLGGLTTAREYMSRLVVIKVGNFFSSVKLTLNRLGMPERSFCKV